MFRQRRRNGNKHSSTVFALCRWNMHVILSLHLSNKSKRNYKVVNMCFRCFDFSPHCLVDSFAIERIFYRRDHVEKVLCRRGMHRTSANLYFDFRAIEKILSTVAEQSLQSNTNALTLSGGGQEGHQQNPILVPP